MFASFFKPRRLLRQVCQQPGVSHFPASNGDTMTHPESGGPIQTDSSLLREVSRMDPVKHTSPQQIRPPGPSSSESPRAPQLRFTELQPPEAWFRHIFSDKCRPALA
jgi:hypothetical protein